MPDMSGGEVLDRLKTIQPDCRVLLTSGYNLDGEAGRYWIEAATDSSKSRSRWKIYPARFGILSMHDARPMDTGRS